MDCNDCDALPEACDRCNGNGPECSECGTPCPSVGRCPLCAPDAVLLGGLRAAVEDLCGRLRSGPVDELVQCRAEVGDLDVEVRIHFVARRRA